jgi:hypothetical protein
MLVCEVNLGLGAVGLFFFEKFSGEFHQRHFHSFGLDIHHPVVGHNNKLRRFFLPLVTQVEKLWENV